jgi:hypothetical protein
LSGHYKTLTGLFILESLHPPACFSWVLCFINRFVKPCWCGCDMEYFVIPEQAVMTPDALARQDKI